MLFDEGGGLEGLQEVEGKDVAVAEQLPKSVASLVLGCAEAVARVVEEGGEDTWKLSDSFLTGPMHFPPPDAGASADLIPFPAEQGLFVAVVADTLAILAAA